MTPEVPARIRGAVMLRVMLWGWGVSINPISLGNTPPQPPACIWRARGYLGSWEGGEQTRSSGGRGVPSGAAGGSGALGGRGGPGGAGKQQGARRPPWGGEGAKPVGCPTWVAPVAGREEKSPTKPPEEKGSRGGYLSRGNKKQNGHFGNKRDKSRKIGGWVPSPPFFFPVPQAAEWAAGLAGAGAGRNWVTRSRLIAKVAGIKTGARGWAHGEGSKRDGGSSPCPAQLWGRILPTHELWGHRPWAALVVGTPWGRRGEGPRPLQTTHPRSWREGAASSPAGPASPILLGS